MIGFLLLGGFIGSMVLLMAHMLYRAFHDVITEETAYIHNLSTPFISYRIFFIADVHRRKIKQTTIEQVKEPIDAVFLGGDMIEAFVPLKRLEKNIQLLTKWDVPIFFVAGNNDYEKDKEALDRLFIKYNIIILEDSVYQLWKDNECLRIVGFPYIMDEEVRSFDFTQLREEQHILLAHSPYAYYHLSSDKKTCFSFVLAGHTHGGQIRIFSFGPYRPGGWRYDADRSMFITEGYGYSLLPFRLGTEAQCHVITLEEKQE